MKQLTPRSLPSLAVNAGDVSPNIPQANAWVWSTVLGKPLYWNGFTYLDLTPTVGLALSNAPTLPVAVTSDPQVTLSVNGTAQSKIMMKPLTSVGGVNLGLLVTDTQ